ncbi:MAG: type 4a pilus biogenesis protein PilO [Candidatus Eisenbacteria bacterium]|nr:type 4a pilus biogenesis protein PilO [Candidatus Eisenbacteria bacterium]
MGFRSWTGFALILAICALLIAGDAAVFRPARVRLHELNSALAISQNESTYLKANPEHFELVASFLPQKSDDPNGGEQRFLSKISERIKSAGMTMTDVEPRKVTEDGSYTRRQFKLEVKGEFREFASFLRYLETMPEVVLINSFDLTSGTLRKQDSHSATMTLTVIGY